MLDREDFRETPREVEWRVAAISLAITTVPLVIAAIIWIYNAADADDAVKRINILSPFGVLYVALITFCTVVWRGLISARQASYQQQQLEALARQIASSEENNLALLLQKGAELLADIDKRSHLAGGIATLQAVIAAENTKFVQEAMEVVADFIDEKFQNSNDEPLFRSAVKALELGHQRGFTAARTLDFETGAELDTLWTPFRGVTGISYTGGHVLALSAEAFKDRHLRFRNVTFHECSIPSVGDYWFGDCVFRDCRIGEVALSKNGRARFEDCDFSGSQLGGSIVADVEFLGCHYRRGSPPAFPPEWLEKLDVREEAAISLELPTFKVTGSAVVLNAPANSQKPD